jgi:hypothetical protein
VVRTGDAGRPAPPGPTHHDRVAEELELTNEENARSIAKQRILEACMLAADYGEHYDGYIDAFDAAVEEYDIDPFEAKEDEKLKYLLYPEWKAEEEWLTYSRNDQLNALDDLSEAGWRVVQDVLGDASPVDALIHRNTRDTLRKYEKVGLLDETVPNRNPEQREIELTEETREVYDRIDDYTRKFYKLAQQSDEAETRAIGFVMTTYRQRLTSSVYAISQSLQNRLETLRTQHTVLKGKQRAADRERGQSGQVVLDALSEYDIDDPDELDELQEDLEDTDLSEVVPNVTDHGLDLLEDEIDELESFVHDLRQIDRDPKIGQLTEDLARLDREGHNRKIVFTQYADTMDFIRDQLVATQGATVATYSGRGGEIYDPEDGSWITVGKERVKRAFADDNEKIDILVCTDSASEGLNLQECGVLINYDLPWNPMRVEQRIGRIDRIGQRFDDITILNYSYKDTVETDIYDRLDDRIGLFENVVGDMQPILSGVSQQIRNATLNADTGDDQQAVEEADRQFSEQIEEQERGDRVDVGESLESVDSLVAQDVIDEAKLEAWQSYRHPDISDVADSDYKWEIPYQNSGLESLLRKSTALAEAGFEFVPVANLGSEIDDEYARDFDFEGSTYRLSTPDTDVELPRFETKDEQTVAQAVAPDEEDFAVTFDPDCADAFPSVHYLAPGHPLLDRLVSFVRRNSEGRTRLVACSESRTKSSFRPVVQGWRRKERFARIGDAGDVIEDQPFDGLQSWCEAFLENRGCATNSQ